MLLYSCLSPRSFKPTNEIKQILKCSVHKQIRDSISVPETLQETFRLPL